MHKGQLIIMAMIILAIITIGNVSATSDYADDIITQTDINEIENIEVKENRSENNNEILSFNNDSDILNDNAGTFSELVDEIGSGGNIILSKDTYTYDSGSTIEITTAGTIDGNGAVIDMAGSNIRVFTVNVSGVTFKNITFKNVKINTDGIAIYFISSGSVTNCNFINNTAGNYNHGAVYFGGTGTVTDCNFYNNTGYYGAAIRFQGRGTVTNCNFTRNYANSYGGEYISMLKVQ